MQHLIDAYGIEYVIENGLKALKGKHPWLAETEAEFAAIELELEVPF